jgi:hypothetical protein
MSDEKSHALSVSSRALASTSDVLRPATTLLPSKSGTWLPSRKKDKEFVEEGTNVLRARTAQSNAMRELVDSRIGLGFSLLNLAAMPEICATEYLKGRRQRASDLALTELRCQEAELTAKAAVAAAHKHLATINPLARRPTSTRASSGLTPDEVDDVVAAALPEVAETTRKTLFQLLMGRLQEKNT